jgi:hypothetical protein
VYIGDFRPSIARRNAGGIRRAIKAARVTAAHKKGSAQDERQPAREYWTSGAHRRVRRGHRHRHSLAPPSDALRSH